MSAADNLLANIDKVIYTSYFNTEKIVRVFEGTYIQGTDTTTVAYDLGNRQVYRIAHGFSRPVFPDLYWSLDDDSYFIGGGNMDTGGNGYAIAFSDSTYVYIMAIDIPSTTTIYYKVVCSWIDNYDVTNPSVPEFTDYPDNYKRNFDATYATPMIVREGVLEFSTNSGSITNVTQVIPHGLDYAPFGKIYVESLEGQVWPLNYGGATNPYLVQSDQVEGVYFTDPTNLIVDATMKASNGTRRFWYFLFSPVTVIGTITGTPNDVGL